MSQAKANKQNAHFADSMAHIQAELQRLDKVIERAICLFRNHATNRALRAAPAHLCISDEEVDTLLQETNGQPAAAQKLGAQIDAMEHDIEARAEQSVQQGVFLPLIQLARLFSLNWMEYQALLVCLAPELRRHYDRFYAYLQDDIARKKPSIDLLLQLFAPEESERWRARAALGESSALFQHSLVESVEDTHSPSGSSDLARFIRLNPRILDYLLGHRGLDVRLKNFLQLYTACINLEALTLEAVLKQKLSSLLKNYLATRQPGASNLLVYLYGPAGIGKKTLAAALCAQLGCPLLSLNLAWLLQNPLEEFERGLRQAFRESVLLQAALYIDGIDALHEDNRETQVRIQLLERMLHEYGWISFAGGRQVHLPETFSTELLMSSFKVTLPDAALQAQSWRHFMPTCEHAAELVARYPFTPGRIKKAAQLARLATYSEDRDNIDPNLLQQACRHACSQGLGRYARKIEAHYRWGDLILPEDIKLGLRNICDQVRHAPQVMQQWRFAEKLAYGSGLSVLFSGVPGTGKTMTAQVIANDLQLDLYKIDLSGVVSKYIGETEKNLGRIFDEAESSNAILFFDEADALFGKRTEVSDAHDRYANIEVSYLLQKMEEYSGIVILATNFRNNMDDAFTRRIRFIVEFPFPDQDSREQIWRKNMPAEAPLAADVDFALLASRVKVAGGNIKNILLNAAFYAAQQQSDIDMRCILHSIRQEYRKIGKLWDENSIVTMPRKRMGV